MDKETKNFFEKLSGVNNRIQDEEETELDPETEEELAEVEDDDEEEEETEENEESGLDNSIEDTEGQLTVDVYETPTHYVVKSTVAGVDEENLDISITNESVTIKGSREQEEKVKTATYLHQECYWGKFSRSIILPQEIDPDKATASLKNGVLKISLPKINRQKSKRLKIKLE